MSTTIDPAIAPKSIELAERVMRRVGLTSAILFGLLATLLSFQSPLRAESANMSQLPIVVARDQKTARARLEENVQEIEKTYSELGIPFAAETVKSLHDASRLSDYDAIGTIQTILDRYALVDIGLNDEAWFSLIPASADPKERVLTKGRWQTFLVKLDNGSRVTSPLEVRSGQALETLSEENANSKEFCVQQPHDWSKWFLMRMIGPPLMPALMTGKEVEYFVIQLCSLDAGDRAAELTFYLGGGQVSQGHYGSIVMVFKAVDPPLPMSGN